MLKEKKIYKISLNNRGGYILMLSLIIMLTLTVIATGYVANVILENEIVKNFKVNRDMLNASEGGLDVAMRITHEEIVNNLEPFSGTERTAYVEENETKYGYSFQTLFDNFNGFKVKYRVIPENPDPQKNRFLYRSYVSCSEMIHYAYPYILEVVAEPTNGTGGAEYLKRQIRVLETPLVQYFVFYNDDLPWHPGPTMNVWGRIHTNGNIWFGPDGNYIYIKNLANGTIVQHFITASGSIFYNSVLGPSPAWTTRTGKVYVRVYHLTSTTENQALYADTTAGDYVRVNTDITSANAETQRLRFTDANNCSYVMTGVPQSPSISFNATFRNGFYEKKARAPERSEYFGLTIVIEGGGAGANWPPRTLADHTGKIHIYAATKDFAYDYKTYTDGVKIEDVTNQVFNAGSVIESGTNGDIVFSPETYAHPLSPPAAFPTTDTDAEYPVYLERNDQRQDMKGVALTVVNLQKLEKWFYEYYLDYQYDEQADNQNIDKFLTDDLTGNPTKLVVYVSRTPTVAEVPGWAGYTVDGGPPYPYYSRPNLPMTYPPTMVNIGTEILQAIKIWRTKSLVCPTTIVTDNPVYVEGDFNIGEGSYTTKGCAVIGDLVTLLSNSWHCNYKYTSGPGTCSGTTRAIADRTGGRPNPNVNNTVAMCAPSGTTEYRAAFFTGRDDLATFAARGGPYNEETDGLHNLLGFQENWGAATCKISGSLINLWFTRQALGLFSSNSYAGGGSGPTNVYSPPTRNFGWDPGYASSNYWPPYCPSAYSVEKVGWLEGNDYSDEYIWDPSKQ